MSAEVLPYVPPDIKELIKRNEYELRCAHGFYWYVCGEDDGEPFELGLELFIALSRNN